MSSQASGRRRPHCPNRHRHLAGLGQQQQQQGLHDWWSGNVGTTLLTTTLPLMMAWMLIAVSMQAPSVSGYGDKGQPIKGGGGSGGGNGAPGAGAIAAPNDLLPSGALAAATQLFTTRNNSRVIAQRGGLAILPCAIKWNPSATVSWIRRRDFQLLTVGLSTYSSDERFLVEHARHMGHWSLRIKSVREEDRGWYECQLSVHPIQSIYIELRVVEAVADIIGAPDVHIDEGSMLRLECILKRATENPTHIFWYHNGKMINYDQHSGYSVSTLQQHQHQPLHLPHTPMNRSLQSPASTSSATAATAGAGRHTATGGGTATTRRSGAAAIGGVSDYTKILATTNLLTIEEVSYRHAGNYTCAPSNARPISVTVHVLSGEKPAAMQHANRSSSASSSGTAGCQLRMRATHWAQLYALFALMLGCCTANLVVL